MAKRAFCEVRTFVHRRDCTLESSFICETAKYHQYLTQIEQGFGAFSSA